MADTLGDTPIPLEDYQDIYALTNITPGVPITVQNVGVTDLHFAIAPTKPDRTNTAFRIFKRGEIIIFNDGDLAVWIFSPQADGLINVEELIISIPSDFYVEVVKGNIPGSRIVLINGDNPDVGITSPENIWGPGDLLVYPIAGEQWELVFADANDTALGDGAREVTVFYLDDTYTEQTEVVASNGGTVAMVATDAFRLIKVIVTDVGSTGSNEGPIEIQVSGGGNSRGRIFTSANQTLNGFYTTPAGKSAFLVYGYTSIQKNKDASMAMFVTEGDNGIFVEILPLRVYQNSFAIDSDVPVGPLIEKTDLQVVVSSENNGTDATLVIQVLEVDN